jgi:tetratricopeptide (TPR) repeat protein
MKQAGAGVVVAVLVMGWALAARSGPASEESLAQGFERLDHARRSLDGAELKQVQVIFSQWVAGHPQDPRGHYGLARTDFFLYSYYHEVKKDPVRAEAVFEQALTEAKLAADLLPSNGQVHALLGRLYQIQTSLHPVSALLATMTGESPVLSEFRRALALDPDNVEAEIGLGAYCLFAPKVAGGDRERALRHLRRAAKLDPQDPEALTWLAVAFREKGDLAEARQTLDQALALDPAYRFARNENLRLLQAESRRGASAG